MKLENPILDPIFGTVEEVTVTPGQLVKTGDTLTIIDLPLSIVQLAMLVLRP